MRIDRCPVLLSAVVAVLAALPAAACGRGSATTGTRASGYVEATEVRVAPEIGGRIMEMKVDEGSRVAAGDVVVRLSTTDTELAMQRMRAERDQADAQLRLLQAGSRAEDIQQARAQAAAAAADIDAAKAEVASSEQDLERFESLLRASSGSRKQRDDAATRRHVAIERLRAAEERARGARAVVARLRSGARAQEIDAARARVAAVDAQLAALEKAMSDAVVTSPVGGIVTEKLADAGEIVAARTPLLVVADLDHTWVNVFVDEPVVPRIRLGQRATVFTDAGGTGIPGTVTFVSPRAEFTPRNVQTADERSRLVYRVKVTVENRSGVLKQGMPVEADIPLQPVQGVR